MGRVLVIYGTKTGCTAGVAEMIGSTLADLGAPPDVRPAANDPDPAGYDAVIVGSGVRAGQWHTPVKEWVITYAGVLKGVHHALFTTCLTMANEPKTFSLPERLILKAMKAPQGDYRDRDAIVAWTRGVWVKLGSPGVAPGG